MPKINNKKNYPNVSSSEISLDDFLTGTVAATGKTRSFPLRSIRNISGNSTLTDRVEVIGSTITSALFEGLDSTTVKTYCLAHADGMELLTRQDTQVVDSNNGIVDLKTTAYAGKTVYVKRFVN